ncbi:MAG: fused MFS/spermidine synthase [Polyangia bacterium]
MASDLPAVSVTARLLTVVLAASLASTAHAAASGTCDGTNLLSGRRPVASTAVTGDPALVTDGAVVAEGAVWDGPPMLKLQPGGSLTYDLGQPRSIGAVYLEADANDTYTLSGSPDGSPGTFKVLTIVANVVERGPGVRARAVEVAPATVRYLRVGDAVGDGAYSIAELAVFCAPPKPFPPAFRTVESPMAAAPIPANEHYVDDGVPVPPPPPLSQVLLLLVSLALVVGGWVWTRALRTPAVAPSAAPSAIDRSFWIVLLLFVGSGGAALIYEVIWLQLLQFVIGSSAVSIGVLLATFMGGMGIGSVALARYVRPGRHPLRIYAVIELAIAACGLLVLVAMPAVQGAYVAIVGHGIPGLLLRGVFAALCLLPPTVLMGATLPAVARWVQTTPRGVARLGFFYGGNTVGAVFGCLLAGFYLLRVWDMRVATLVAGLINLAVAAGALALARVTPATPPPVAGSDDVAGRLDAAAPATGAWAVYLAIALSGATALGAEIVWTRLLALLMGATTYTFSIVLAVFLIGIALGSGVGSAIARRTAAPRFALGVTQLLLIGAIGWTAWNLTGSLPYWPINPIIASGPWFQFQTDLARCLWAVLPPACLWGASFPLALASVATGAEDGGRVVGRVYAANTAGAIAGALAFSLLIVVWLGTLRAEWTLLGLAALAAVAALAPTFVAGSQAPRLSRTGAIWTAVVVQLAVVVGRQVPPLPPMLVGHGRTMAATLHDGERYLYVGEGLSADLAVSRSKFGILSYHNAGKTQASSQPQDMRLQRMLGHLTTLLVDSPRNVLVVACGAGVTAGAVSVDPRVERLTIAEIEGLVPKEVGERFADYNNHLIRNPPVHIAIDDGRHFLTTTKQTFDAITSDPFDPWVKGAATLYTREFWELAKRHLNPGGVVTVWVPLYESNTATVKSEVATFFQAFPDGLIFGNTVGGEGYDMVMVGTKDRGPFDVDKMTALLAQPEMAVMAKSLREIGFTSATAMLATYGGTAPDLAPWLRDAQINRDNNLRLQYLAGLNLNEHQAADTYRAMLSYRRYPDHLFTGSPASLATLRTTMLGGP